MPQGFGARAYQHWGQSLDLCSFRVTIQETDLLILAKQDLSDLVTQRVHHYRAILQAYIQENPAFQASFEPIDVAATAPALIRDMAWAARLAGVGPLAAVAGAIAESVGRDLLPYSSEVLVENGGDIFIAGTMSRTIGIFAGRSPLTGKLGIRLAPADLPCGVCTSSGTVGHSISFGRADAAIVLAASTSLADACATALGNRVRHPEDIPAALEVVGQIPGVRGGVVILGAKIGVCGQVNLVKTTPPQSDR